MQKKKTLSGATIERGALRLLPAQLRKAAAEDTAVVVGALLGREDKAQFINAKDEVRCRCCQHSMRMPIQALIFQNYAGTAAVAPSCYSCCGGRVC